MRVEDIMTRNPSSCDTRASLDNVARVMWDRDCGCVPIVNGSGTLMGLVTDRDVAMAAYIQGKRLADIPVTEVMSRHVHCCEVGVSIELAHQIMRSAGIRRLPVIDPSGKLVGLVSWSDMLSAVQREPVVTVAEGMTGEIIETVDATSKHHCGASAAGAATHSTHDEPLKEISQ